jgi:beta-lactamase regulating signal transducer with metallopeptidase domain
MNAFLVELVVRSIIIACLGLGLRFALIRFSAQARAKVLTLTMFALAVLPVAMLLLPKVPVTVGKVQAELPTSVVSNEIAVPVSTNLNLWAMIWLSVVGISTTRVLISLFQFRKVEQGLSLASEPVTVRVRSLTNRAKGVFYSPEGEPPMTWGMVNPKIALPTESETWIEPEFRSVVLHEDAHIRRRDWAVSIGFRFIAALYWFNPCVWLLRAYFEQDSERAADDFVLAQGFDAPEYAERLLGVAQKLRPCAGRLPTVTMARTNRLNGRLRAILSSRTPREPMKGWKKVSVLGVLGCGALAGGFILPVIEQLPALNTRTETNSSKSEPIAAKPLTMPEGEEALDHFDPIEGFSTENFEANAAPTSHVLNSMTEASPTMDNVDVQPTPQVHVSVKGGNVRTEATSTTHSVANSSSGPDAEVDEDCPELEDQEDPSDSDDPEDFGTVNAKSLQEADRIRKRAMAEAQRDIDNAHREAQREIERARKESQKEIRKAMEECGKSGVDLKGLGVDVDGISLGAMKFGEEMAKSMGEVAVNLSRNDDKKSAKGAKGTKAATNRNKSENAKIKVREERPKEANNP